MCFRSAPPRRLNRRRLALPKSHSFELEPTAEPSLNLEGVTTRSRTKGSSRILCCYQSLHISCQPLLSPMPEAPRYLHQSGQVMNDKILQIVNSEVRVTWTDVAFDVHK